MKGEATLGSVFAYLAFSTPEFVYYVVPMAVLLAVLVTIGLLTKTSELTIMHACGVSLYRAAAPLLLLGMLAGGFLFLVQEKALARGKTQAEALSDQMRGRPRTTSVLNRRWMAGRTGRLYHYAGFAPRARRLERLSIFEIDAQAWRVTRQIFTPAARFRDGVWMADAGWVQTFPEGGPPTRTVLPAGPLDGLEEPDYFGKETTAAPDKMALPALRQYVADLESSGADANAARVEYHRKIAFPLVTIVMTLIAVPFAVTTGRRGALYGIGLGIALSIAYWFMLTIFGAMGSAGVLPPALAAWAPNLFFAAGAGYLLLTVRT